MDENRLNLIKLRGRSDDPNREKVWVFMTERHDCGEVYLTVCSTKAAADRAYESYLVERIHDYIDEGDDNARLLQMSGRELSENVDWYELTGDDESLSIHEQGILD